MVQGPLETSATARAQQTAGHSLLPAAVHRPLASPEGREDPLPVGVESPPRQFPVACDPKQRPSVSYHVLISRPPHLLEMQQARHVS